MRFARFFTSKGTGCPVLSDVGTKARRGHSGLAVSPPLVVHNAGVSPTTGPEATVLSTPTKPSRGHSGLAVSTPLIVRNAGVSPVHKPLVGLFQSRNRLARFLSTQIAWPILLLVVLGGARARPKSVGELVIIANTAVRTEAISAEDLRSVYLGTKTSLDDGTRLKPVLEKPGPAHTVFLKEYMGKSDVALQTYYRSLLFSGKWSIPVTLRSDSEMVAYVAKTPDAIGYAQSNAVIQGVKILHIK